MVIIGSISGARTEMVAKKVSADIQAGKEIAKKIVGTEKRKGKKYDETLFAIRPRAFF